MRMYMLNKLRASLENDAKDVQNNAQVNIQQLYPHVSQCSTKIISKHKYWNKVSKKNKLQMLMEYINREYEDKQLKTEYSLKITVMLNNGDLNNNECVDFDYINNRITKLNFNLDNLEK